MAPRRAVRVAIVGAGIGGLMTARALAQRGFEVDIHERANALGEVGAGLQLGPNAYKVFRALGLEDRFRKIAYEPQNRIVLNWNDASLRGKGGINGDDIALYGGRYLTAHRADLHDMLRTGLPDARIHLGRQCISVESNFRGGVARFADGLEVEADLVVGADGVRSIVRESLFGADRPRFTNSICWRCILPMSEMPTRVGPNGSVALEPGDHLSWYGPTGQVICYPLGDGSRLNVFAGHVSDGWVAESWSTPSSREELIKAYEGWNDALLDMFTKVDHCYKWGIFDREPLNQWTSGRVTLLGDAAHPTMPNLAQGANMAIEDGFVLARALARGDGDMDAALRQYVAERQPRTARITLQSRENFERTRQWPPAPPMDRSWIFKFDATREPENATS